MPGMAELRVAGHWCLVAGKTESWSRRASGVKSPSSSTVSVRTGCCLDQQPATSSQKRPSSGPKLVIPLTSGITVCHYEDGQGFFRACRPEQVARFRAATSTFETDYWIELLFQSGEIEPQGYESIHVGCRSPKAQFGQFILHSSKNLRFQPNAVYHAITLSRLAVAAPRSRQMKPVILQQPCRWTGHGGIAPIQHYFSLRGKGAREWTAGILGRPGRPCPTSPPGGMPTARRPGWPVSA